MAFSTEVRELAFKMHHHFCGCAPECGLLANEVHHQLANTKPNRKRFPLFIDSIFNACAVNHECHMRAFPLPRIGTNEAEAYEEYLKGVSK